MQSTLSGNFQMLQLRAISRNGYGPVNALRARKGERELAQLREQSKENVISNRNAAIIHDGEMFQVAEWLQPRNSIWIHKVENHFVWLRKLKFQIERLQTTSSRK